MDLCGNLSGDFLCKSGPLLCLSWAHFQFLLEVSLVLSNKLYPFNAFWGIFCWHPVLPACFWLENASGQETQTLAVNWSDLCWATGWWAAPVRNRILERPPWNCKKTPLIQAHCSLQWALTFFTRRRKSNISSVTSQSGLLGNSSLFMCPTVTVPLQCLLGWVE